MFDYSKLIARVVEKCGTRSNFAKKMGISEHSISMKLSAKSFWKQAEIALACSVLDIDYKDIPIYFFTPKVQSF